MTRHVVVGTAGHVDHGKTALVKALTGTDTDRWEEEKRRGITIDLGFARLDLGDGLVASVVDVPGHEDFVRNMVAGATGIDVALLVIAADEGVMPQTVEHLAILEFLGVRTGVVAISKIDLVDADWLELVQADVAERIHHSSIRWDAPVGFSAVSGQGSEELRTALARAADRAVQRSDADAFRMPIDRVFSAPGAGTVVTGTTWSGTVSVGDDVRVLPGDRRTRVRSIEVHGEARERAEPGRRTALALPGVAKADVARGCVVVTGPSWRASTSIDVMLTMLPEARPLTQRSRVRLHIGTAEVMARVTPATEEIAAGTTAAARLRLEQPVVARWGDRGVLRSYSPMRTIGGCVVIDPAPPSRPRRPIALETRASPDPAKRLPAFVQSASWAGLPTVDLLIRVGVHPEEAVSLGAREGAAIVLEGDRWFSRAVIEEARQATTAALTAYHRDRPLEPGMPRELLRQVLRNPDLADRIQADLAAESVIVLTGGSARLRAFQPSLSAEQERWIGLLEKSLGEAGPHGLTESELGELLPEGAGRPLAEYLVRQGSAVRVGRDRYYASEAIETVRNTILGELRERGRASPSELREKTGLTRKYLIPILEWMDGAGFTVRDGDARRIGPAAAARDPGS
jgi:selenocysteine-specific elongation factor